MSISLKNERLLTFDEAAELLPQSRRPSKTTWWRWWRLGIDGVQLDTAVVGGRRYTTAEAVKRFATRLTDHRAQSKQLAAAPAARPQSLVAIAVPREGGTV